MSRRRTRWAAALGETHRGTELAVRDPRILPQLIQECAVDVVHAAIFAAAAECGPNLRWSCNCVGMIRREHTAVDDPAAVRQLVRDWPWAVVVTAAPGGPSPGSTGLLSFRLVADRVAATAKLHQDESVEEIHHLADEVERGDARPAPGLVLAALPRAAAEGVGARGHR